MKLKQLLWNAFTYPLLIGSLLMDFTCPPLHVSGQLSSGQLSLFASCCKYKGPIIHTILFCGLSTGRGQAIVAGDRGKAIVVSIGCFCGGLVGGPRFYPSLWRQGGLPQSVWVGGGGLERVGGVGLGSV